MRITHRRIEEGAVEIEDGSVTGVPRKETEIEIDASLEELGKFAEGISGIQSLWHTFFGADDPTPVDRLGEALKKGNL